jgi:hypothetical protein
MPEKIKIKTFCAQAPHTALRLNGLPSPTARILYINLQAISQIAPIVDYLVHGDFVLLIFAQGFCLIAEVDQIRAIDK